MKKAVIPEAGRKACPRKREDGFSRLRPLLLNVPFGERVFFC